jgi:hypothetical protein
LYDNPYWEHHLPVNPPGAHFREDFDVMMTEVELTNWDNEGGWEFRPRPRADVQMVSRLRGFRRVEEDEATELDVEYDCE